MISTTKRRNANLIGHIVRSNCILRHVIEGKIDGKRRRGGRRKQLWGDLKEKILGLKEDVLDRNLANYLGRRLRNCRKTD